ncbi:MAG: septal ring lytic transglycosylase RlpA family protein [Candidatus Obscuribacterales bacterium]
MNRVFSAIVVILALAGTVQTACFAAKVAGKATVYSDSYQGKKTASGARYNRHAMTAASAQLPLGTKVKVRNKQNGRSTTVVINDRKARGGAVIDLSKSAANKLGVKGTAPVEAHTVK